MRKEIAALLLATVLTAACTRSAGPPGSPDSATTGETGTAPGNSSGQAPPRGETQAASEMATRLVAPLSGGKPIRPADDAGWLAAKRSLESLLRASPKEPAPGLPAQLAAYLRRPEVAALPEAIALGGIRGIITLGGYTGTKQALPPEDPRVYLVRSPYDGASPWQIALLQWLDGGQPETAVLPERNVHAFRFTTSQGRPRLLTFQYTSKPDDPLGLATYEYRDGRLLPLPLPESLPAEVGGVTVTRVGENQAALKGPQTATASHPDYQWACFGDACIAIEWTEAGLALKPAGFTGAEAQKRLISGDANRVQTDRSDWRANVDQRLLTADAMDEPAASLAARTGTQVSVRTVPGDEARVVHFSTLSWLGGKGYQTAAKWLQWRGPGINYLVWALDGGAYRDHRILRDGDRSYVLVLAEAEPRPSSSGNTLSMYEVDGEKLLRAKLPEDLLTMGQYSFLSMDGSLLLRCRVIEDPPSSCELLRWNQGTFAVESNAVLTTPLSEAVRQARAASTERLRSGDAAGAAQGFRQVVALAPGFVDAWNDLSFAYQKLGDWSAAAVAAAVAVRLNPKSGAARYNAGVSYAALGALDRAVSELQEAAKLQPDDPTTWLALAGAREAALLRITAQQAYETAARLDPANAEAARGIKRMNALLD